MADTTSGERSITQSNGTRGIRYFVVNAEALRAKGRYEEAIDLLRRGISEIGEIGELYLLWGHVLADQSRWEQARWKYLKANSLDRSTTTLCHCAIALHSLGRDLEAYKWIEQAVELDANQSLAWRCLIEVSASLGDVDEKIRALENLCRLQPKDPRWPFEILRELSAFDDEVDESVERCEKMLEKFGSDLLFPGNYFEARTRVLLSDLLLRKQDVLASLDQAREACRVLERNALDEYGSSLLREARMLMASRQLRLKMYSEVKAAATNFGVQGPIMSIFGSVMKASIAATKGDYATTWRYFYQVYRTYCVCRKDHPDWIQADLEKQVGLVMVLMGMYDESSKLLASIAGSDRLQLEVLLIEVYLYLEWADVDVEEAPARLSIALEKARDAENRLIKKIDRRPSAEDLLSLGNLMASIGAYESAEAALRRARDLDCSRADIRSALGVVLANRGKGRSAARELTIALKMEPESLEFRRNLAEVLRTEGALDTAETELRDILLRAPLHLEAMVSLAEVLIAQGDAGKADSYVEADEWLDAAIRASAEDAIRRPSERKSSGPITPRQLSEVHYSRGYLMVKDYEGRRYASRRGITLARAETEFLAAVKIDPRNLKAKRASAAVGQRRADERLRSASETVSGAAISLVALAVLVVLQIAYFAGSAKEIDAAAYVSLTMGLLVVMIGASALPRLLKLSVPGVSLEKSAADFEAGAAAVNVFRKASSFASSRPFAMAIDEYPNLRQAEPAVRRSSPTDEAADRKGRQAPQDAKAARTSLSEDDQADKSK